MRGKKPDAIGLGPPEWVNDAGYQHHSRRGFERALQQIEDERLATREERAAASPKFPGPPYAPPERGGQGSVVALVVIATALALATTMALLVYLAVSLGW